MRRKFLPAGLLVLLMFSSCYDDALYNESGFTFEKLVQNVVVSNNILLANGIDTASVLVYFETDANTVDIDFHAKLSNGKFDNNGKDSISAIPQLQTNSFGEVSKFIPLKIVSSLNPGQVDLTMNMNGYVQVINLTFDRNCPDNLDILAEPKVFNRKLRENIELKTILSSEFGSPSFGTEIDLHVTDTMSNNLGELVYECNFEQNSTECISLFNIWPDTAYIGEIIVTATLNNCSGVQAKSINLYTTD